MISLLPRVTDDQLRIPQCKVLSIIIHIKMCLFIERILLVILLLLSAASINRQ